MRSIDAPARIGVLIYDGVEPIDIGGTVGVISMARRVVPNLSDAVIARLAGPIRMAGGLVVQAPYGIDDAPDCDRLIVCGGPGWPETARDPGIRAYLAARAPERLASVCTGALILGEAGVLDGRGATTRRTRAGAETQAPLDRLAETTTATILTAAIVDDGIVTGGGVSLAIDVTLYLLGQIYGEPAREAIATLIEYDRAYAANRDGLGIVRLDRAVPAWAAG